MVTRKRDQSTHPRSSTRISLKTLMILLIWAGNKGLLQAAAATASGSSSSGIATEAASVPDAERPHCRQDLLEIGGVSLNISVGPWDGLKDLVDAQVGESRAGIAELKSYLLRFGYIDSRTSGAAAGNFTEVFDNLTQGAVKLPQQSFGLPPTGRLDIVTLAQMTVPRCGREDVINGTLLMLQNGLTPGNLRNSGSVHVGEDGPVVGVGHYATFPGSPRWKKKNITYAFDLAAVTPDVGFADTEAAIADAFAAWAAVVPLTFTRVQDYWAADIRISFDRFRHGDKSPFDGPLGILAHAFAPPDGRFHFDNSESWSIDVQGSGSATAIDLASVATHEIGHLLGLAHTSKPDAIMYPSIAPRKVKRVLATDDINGAQALYGVNPNYSPATALTSGHNSLQRASSMYKIAIVFSALGFLLQP